MDEKAIVFDPTASSHGERANLRQTLDGLSGKVIGFIDNAKPNFHYLVDDLAELFTSKYAVSAVVKRRKSGAGIPATEAIMKELTDQCDLVIAGSGD
jgi:hypothetical protein